MEVLILLNRLVIAEKPSTAQVMASVLGAKQRQDGFLEGNGYLVSWCFGHLAELAAPSVYNAAYEKWRLSDLPIFPEEFQFCVRPEKKRQFDVLKYLLTRKDVSDVVNACDAGREGELIFRIVYALAGCDKPIKRLWISSMEESAIQEGFSNLRDGKEYDGLYQAALCRAKADWLVGINASRFFTLTYGRTLNIGRVMSPTLALLVQREAEIAAFVPEPFYTVHLNCGFSAVSERFAEKAEAEQLVAKCSGKAVVKAVKRRERTENAPPLYDLTTLQREANRTLNFTAQQTLDYAQALYEKKLCTYPRTDSRFLTNEMADSVPALFAAAAAITQMEEIAGVSPKQVCDSAAVSDHHALIPTVSAGEAQIDSLPLGERQLLTLLARGLLRAVAEPFRYTETAAEIECGGHLFTAKGRTILGRGWKLYEEAPETEIMIPDLSEGQTVPVSEAIVQGGKTTPAKHLTEDTLLSSMERAGAHDMPKDAERRGIGTPATRAGILEKLVSTGFTIRKKSKTAPILLPTDLGKSLITVLPEQLQSPQLTAEWEEKLKKVEHGEMSPEKFMAGIEEMLRNLFKTYQAVPGAEVLFPTDREAVGKCPRCGRMVREYPKGFFCEGRDCGFVLWKNSRFFEAKKKQLTKSVAAALLKDGRVELAGCWSEKTGKTYDATVILDDDGTHADYVLEFRHS